MKKIYLILSFALLAALAPSCEREKIVDWPDGDGENEWNENLISTLDLFFYPEGGTANDCVLHERFEPNEADGDATVTTYTTDEFVSNTLVRKASRESDAFSCARGGS